MEIEVVPRELGLSEETVERLQRAMDRLDCAQAILDAAGRNRPRNSAGVHWEQVRHAVRLLTGNWPQEYPEGAVEWLVLWNRDTARALQDPLPENDHSFRITLC